MRCENLHFIASYDILRACSGITPLAVETLCAYDVVGEEN